MEEKIKVAMVAVDLSRTGISAVIMNYCRNIDLSKFKIDLLVGNHIVEEYRKECNQLGINIIELPFKFDNAKAFYFGLLKKLSAKKYDIVHVHGNSALITPELCIALIKGIRIRIAHCHNTTCSHKMMDKLLRPIFKLVYTDGFACSTSAGKWLFKNGKFDVIPNGFEINKFIFSDINRKQIREKLNIKDKFVIGHIGQFNDQKNHRFLLEMFEKIGNKKKDAILLLIGNGPDKEEICKLIEKHPFKDRIIMYGETEHPEEMYSAMDVFVFPSKFEGLGIVLLEAQISGLQCVASDVVPREAIISKNVELYSLKDDVNEWCNAILSSEQLERKAFYKKYKTEIEKYNINENIKQLMKIYSRLKKNN